MTRPTARGARTESTVRIVLVYPELLGTYGDGGNALVLRERLRRRGHAAVVVNVPAGQPIPGGGDIYLLGGGEDEPQVLAAAALADSPVRGALEAGSALLAVCAGFQIAGESFFGGDGQQRPGAALLPARTRPGSPRLVGDLAVEPAPPLGIPTLIGYENHSGRTALAERAQPLGAVVVGTGNDDGGSSPVDGAVVLPGGALGAGLAIGTYLHGPVLAQNPALADLLASHVVGPLAPLPLEEATALRAARRRQLGLAPGG